MKSRRHCDSNYMHEEILHVQYSKRDALFCPEKYLLFLILRNCTLSKYRFVFTTQLSLNYLDLAYLTLALAECGDYSHSLIFLTAMSHLP